MKIVLQQVQSASVTMEETGLTNEIERGLLAYVCFVQEDYEHYPQTIEKAIALLEKGHFLSSTGKKIDQTIKDAKGEILVISNFTIAGRLEKGKKVDFSLAAEYSQAKEMYDYFLGELIQTGFNYKSGEFGAKMTVKSELYGPVNYVLEV